MARMTLDQINAALDKALADKQIYNIDFVEIRETLTRAMERALDEIKKTKYYPVYHALGHHNDSTFRDAIYTQTYPHTLAGFEKRLPKTVDPMWKPALDAFRAYVAEFKPAAEKLIAVKPFVVKGRKPATVAPEQIVSGKKDLDALKQEKYQLQTKLHGNYSFGQLSQFRTRIREINRILNASRSESDTFKLLTDTLAPAKKQSIEYAERSAGEYYDRLRGIMEKAGWNLDKVIPVPEAPPLRDRHVEGSNYGKRKYDHDMAIQQRLPFLHLFEVNKAAKQKFITKNKIKPYTDEMHKVPVFLMHTDAARVACIETAKKRAAEQFDSYVVKLADKIGPEAESATYEGHIWLNSMLRITMKSGDVQNWTTKQIVNYRDGNPYNQWPTRMVK